MDVSDYLPMFLAECRQHLQELNLSLVELEEHPDDVDAIDSLFRVAHTLKGMSATMGFPAMAKLTHSMEDALDVIKTRSGAVSPALVDIIFECLDSLETMTANIEDHGGEQLDTGDLETRLHAVVKNDGDGASGAGASGGASDAADAASVAHAPSTPLVSTPLVSTSAAGAAPRLDGRRTFHVAVTLAADALLPSVRALQVLTAMQDAGELVESSPGIDDVETFDGASIECVVATDDDAAALEAAASSVPDIAAVEVTALDANAADEAPGADELAAVQAAGDAGAGADAGTGAETATPAAVHAPAERKRPRETTVRVDAERLDFLLHAMGELVVHRTQLEMLLEEQGVQGMDDAVQALARSSQQLQAMVMQVRMVPLESVFMRFPRLVRDLSKQLGKQVELVVTGKETEVDRSIVDTLSDPLVHLIRNSLDHGIEQPEDRVGAGKAEQARLELGARHAGGNVVISVVDDGRGVNPQWVAQIAVKRGLISDDQAAGVDMQQAIELLFQPGFSTNEQANDISGRGVGMDAVREAIRTLGGEVVMTSEVGVGTTTEIRLPLTLAIQAVMLVQTDGQPYAVALDRVDRTVRIGDQAVRSAMGRKMMLLGGDVIPVIDLADTLGSAAAAVDGAGEGVVRDGSDEVGSRRYAVIVTLDSGRMAVLVDHLVGQRELVIRPLPAASDSPALSGGAVLPNGAIALIVDVDLLAADSLAGGVVPVQHG